MRDARQGGDDDDGEERDCIICGGEGYVFGEDMGEPDWYDADEVVRCTSCQGSGLRKDMTWM
ncbi:MAG: hypothetical protein ACRD3C_12440 [Vicinamibacterales bacterium]